MLPKLVILISGNGSNLQALLDAITRGEFKAEPACVISNRQEAYGLVRAHKQHIPTLYVPFAPYKRKGKTRQEYDRDLADFVSTYNPDLIILAGWMRILSAEFLDRFPGKVINLHPAKPGEFPGMHAIERAFEAFQQGEIGESGVMVHHVIPEVDAGPVILSRSVPILPEDTLESFEARVHATEHEVLVAAVKQLLADIPQPTITSLKDE